MTSSFVSSSSRVNRELTSSIKFLNKAATQLSSGSRINSASDDAAGLAIVAALTSDASLRSVASQNAGYAQSATDIASSAISQISDITTRLSELAAQASNGTLSDEQRGSLQAEYSQLQQEATRITETTEFNGVDLFSGSSTGYQVGTDGSSDSTIESGGSTVSAVTSGLPADISTQAAAQATLDGLQSSLNQLSQQQGQLGATQSRLQYADNVNQETRINELAAASRIQDADISSTISDYTSAQLRVKASTFVSEQLRQSESTKYSTLFPKVTA